MPTINEFDPLHTYPDTHTLKQLFKENYTKEFSTKNFIKRSLEELAYHEIDSPFNSGEKIQYNQSAGRILEKTGSGANKDPPDNQARPLVDTIDGLTGLIQTKKTP